jgi:glycosyltransferase involved in cell wall biosynthesis
MPTGISVCLIAKNCAVSLRACLESLASFIRPSEGDEIIVVDTGSTDNGATITAATDNGAIVHQRPDLSSGEMLDLVKKYLPSRVNDLQKEPQFDGGFLTNFSVARTASFSYAKNEWVFWIDSDDILVGGDRLRANFADYSKEPAARAIFLPYEYSFDVDGSCNTILWRERLIKKSLYEWRGRCHEALCPVDGNVSVHRLGDPTILIQHKHGRHHTLSDIRNFAMLMADYEAAPWKDPRTEFYLANALRGLGQWHEAITWYTKVLRRSGSRDDRLSACLNISYAYLVFQRPWKAMNWFFQAIKIWPEEPRAYFGIAKCFFDLQRWQDCLIWTQIGLSLGIPTHITSVDPLSFTFYPHVFEILALQKLNNLPAALKIAEQLVQIRPQLSDAQKLLAELRSGNQAEQVKEALGFALRCAFSDDAAKEILRRFKPEIRKAIPELQLESYCTKPVHSITFVCGKTHEPWDGTSLTDGVGGSEKMVIQLGEALAARGWKVDVYGHPKPENAYKVINKVAYRPAESLDPSLERDIIVLWRSPPSLDFPWKARKIFVDMHDVPTDSDFTPERLKRTAGVIYKSQFHRQLAPSCPDDKSYVFRNGIDLRLITEAEKAVAGTPRNYHKVVWTSSGDRGLLGALKAYALMKNEYPDSEFHVFYGFTPLYLNRAAAVQYQHFGDCGADRHMLDYAEDCFEIMERVGATQHGRINSVELLKHLLTAGIWLYPTKFPEISCISAMEAQACGAYPLCSTTGALAETVFGGSRIDPTDTASVASELRLIMAQGAALDETRALLMSTARARFDLASLTDQWEAICA